MGYILSKSIRLFICNANSEGLTLLDKDSVYIGDIENIKLGDDGLKK